MANANVSLNAAIYPTAMIPGNFALPYTRQKVHATTSEIERGTDQPRETDREHFAEGKGGSDSHLVGIVRQMDGKATGTGKRSYLGLESCFFRGEARSCRAVHTDDTIFLEKYASIILAWGVVETSNQGRRRVSVRGLRPPSPNMSGRRDDGSMITWWRFQHSTLLAEIYNIMILVQYYLRFPPTGVLPSAHSIPAKVEQKGCTPPTRAYYRRSIYATRRHGYARRV